MLKYQKTIKIGILFTTCIFLCILVFRNHLMHQYLPSSHHPTYLAYAKIDKSQDSKKEYYHNYYYDEKHDHIINPYYITEIKNTNNLSQDKFNLFYHQSLKTLIDVQNKTDKTYNLHIISVKKEEDKAKQYFYSSLINHFIVDDRYLVYVTTVYNEKDHYHIGYYDAKTKTNHILASNVDSYKFSQNKKIVYTLKNRQLSRHSINSNQKIIDENVTAYDYYDKIVFYTKKDGFYKQVNQQKAQKISNWKRPYIDSSFDYVFAYRPDHVVCITKNKISKYHLIDFIKDDIEKKSNDVKRLLNVAKTTNMNNTKDTFYHYDGSSFQLIADDMEFHTNQMYPIITQLQDILFTKLPLSQLIKDVDLHDTDQAITQVINNISKIIHQQDDSTGYHRSIFMDNKKLPLGKFPFSYIDTAYANNHRQYIFYSYPSLDDNETDALHSITMVDDHIISNNFYDNILRENGKYFFNLLETNNGILYFKNKRATHAADLYINKERFDKHVYSDFKTFHYYKLGNHQAFTYRKNFDEDTKLYTLMNCNLYEEESNLVGINKVVPKKEKISKHVYSDIAVGDKVYYLVPNDNDSYDLYQYFNYQSKLIDTNVSTIWE